MHSSTSKSNEIIPKGVYKGELVNVSISNSNLDYPQQMIFEFKLVGNKYTNRRLSISCPSGKVLSLIIKKIKSHL